MFTKPGAELRALLRPHGDAAGSSCRQPDDQHQRSSHGAAAPRWPGSTGTADGLGDAARSGATPAPIPRDLDPPATRAVRHRRDHGARRHGADEGRRHRGTRGCACGWSAAGYGFRHTVTWSEAGRQGLAGRRTRSPTWSAARRPSRRSSSVTRGPSGRSSPRTVLTYNDFQYTDRTTRRCGRARCSVRSPRRPTSRPRSTSGFDKPLPVDELGIFFDIVEDPADTLGPARLWEYWDGGAWRRAPASTTRRDGCAMPGLVGLIGPGDEPAARALRHRAVRGLRVRLKEDGPPGAPVDPAAVYPNADVGGPAPDGRRRSDRCRARDCPTQVLAFRAGPRAARRADRGPRARRPARRRRVANRRPRAVPRRRAGDRRDRALLGREGAADVEYGAAAPAARPQQAGQRGVGALGLSSTTWCAPARTTGTTCSSVTRGRCGSATARQGKVPPAGAADQSPGATRPVAASAGNVADGRDLATPGRDRRGRKPSPIRSPRREGPTPRRCAALRGRGPATLRHRGRGLSARDLDDPGPGGVARGRGGAGRSPARSADGRRHPGPCHDGHHPGRRRSPPVAVFGLREAGAASTWRPGPAPPRLPCTGSRSPARSTCRSTSRRRSVPADPNQAGAVERGRESALGTLLHPLLGGPDGQRLAAGPARCTCPTSPPSWSGSTASTTSRAWRSRSAARSAASA